MVGGIVGRDKESSRLELIGQSGGYELMPARSGGREDSAVNMIALLEHKSVGIAERSEVAPPFRSQQVRFDPI
jgi:hypothetical protein